jgi:two-component system sensor histidine kinase MtrB
MSAQRALVFGAPAPTWWRRTRRLLRSWGVLTLRRTRLYGPASGVRGRWRRSLQARVVASTMLLGTVVVLVLGNVLLESIQRGLVDSRTQNAVNDSRRLTSEAQQVIDNSVTSDSAQLNDNVNKLVRQLEGPGGEGGRVVLLQRALNSQVASPLNGRSSSQGISAALVIPTDLRTQLTADGLHSRLISLPATSGPGQVPGLAVGTIIELPLAGPQELYFVYRLDRESEILNLVRRVFIVGGLALVLAVGAVAWVVARQVVSPVRLAAITAEELASGRLDRRMRVRGEDDLARLGRAFNEMAASLERQITRLEELSRFQRRFVSDVSHELRTPLTTIRMASEVIHESRAEFVPVVARSAELLQNQLDRFEELLADLLEISRFDAGAAVLEAEPADVRQVVSRVIELIGPLADRRGTRVRVHVPPVPCLAEVDTRRVERILRNLLGNAVEHGEGGPVDVRVAADADAVAITVADQGVGLRPAELEMVFSRFWRADPARARTTGGTGLGLAIAQEDAHLHGGTLDVWGEPGRGATFRLTLPRRTGVTIAGSPLELGPDPDAGAVPDGDRGFTRPDGVRRRVPSPAGSKPAPGAGGHA